MPSVLALTPLRVRDGAILLVTADFLHGELPPLTTLKRTMHASHSKQPWLFPMHQNSGDSRTMSRDGSSATCTHIRPVFYLSLMARSGYGGREQGGHDV